MATKVDRYGRCESCDALDRLCFTKSRTGIFLWTCPRCRPQVGERLAPSPPPATPSRPSGLDHLQAERFTSEIKKTAPAQAQARSEHPIGQVERPAILVVEDDYDTRNAACAILNLAGFRARSAENGRAGLELLAMLDVQPSLILLDLWMPVMDGWSFYEHVARDRALRSIPVIVLTAYDREVEMGSLKWLRKPIGMDTLLEAVRSTFESAC